MLPGSLFPEHNFRRWARLTSIFLVISFRLEHQAWFRVCVVPLVLVTFASSVLWLDVIVIRLHLHETSRQMCRNHHLHSEPLRDINRIRDEKYHPCPSMIVLSSTTFLPSPNTNLFMFCVIPWVPCYPAFVLLYLGVLPSFMSRMFWDLFHLLRVLGVVLLLTITILSWSSCWFQPGYQQVNGAVWILYF